MITGNKTPDIFTEQHSWFMYQILTSIHVRALTVYYLCSVSCGTLSPDTGLLGPVWLCSSEPLFVRAPASCTASGSTAMALSTSYMPNCRINTLVICRFPQKNHFFFSPSLKKSLLLVGLLWTPKRCLNFSILFMIFVTLFCPVSFVLIMMIKKKKKKKLS